MVEGKIIKDPWFPHVFAVTEIKCPICGTPMASMVWDGEYWYRCTNHKCGYQTPVRGDWNESLAAMPQTKGKRTPRDILVDVYRKYTEHLEELLGIAAKPESIDEWKRSRWLDALDEVLAEYDAEKKGERDDPI